MAFRLNFISAVGLFGLVLLGGTACSVNILENFADKTTNEAIFNEAQQLINKGEYDLALAKLGTVTTEYSAERKVVQLKATAHGGLCGLEFMTFVLAMRNLGSTHLLPFLVSQFKSGSTTSRIDHCIQAEDLIESIGAISTRTTDENLLLALISLAKIGNLLSYYADNDQDGTALTSYNICTIGGAGARTAGGSMPDEDARQLGTGITLALANIAAVGSQVDLGSSSLDELTNTCSALGPFDFCSKTDPTSFSASELLAIRSFAKEGSAIGLDLQTCSGGSVSTAACRCY